MTVGYVKYTGAQASLLNKKVPSGSGKSYNFPRGKYIPVDDKVDFKWFEFKAKANPLDWVAKVRLAGDEKVFGSDRPQPIFDEADPNYDPGFKVDREKRRIAEDMAVIKRKVLQMNSRMLPEEKKELRKLLEAK